MVIWVIVYELLDQPIKERLLRLSKLTKNILICHNCEGAHEKMDHKVLRVLMVVVVLGVCLCLLLSLSLLSLLFLPLVVIVKREILWSVIFFYLFTRSVACFAESVFLGI